MTRVLFLFSALLLAVSSFGQGNTRYTKSDAREDILTLANGVLVVRLESEKRKLDVLEDRMQNMDPDKRQEIREEINETIALRDSFNLNLIKAFKTEFQFCPVFFIYDFDAKRFLDGERQDIFLNEEGEIDNTIEWTDKPYLGLRSGEAKNGPEGLVMTDGSFNDLPDPFPGFVTRNTIGSLFNWLLARDIYWKNNAQRMANKLESKLDNYLN